MRKETARRIEKAFGKPEGWLDIADLIEPSYPEEGGFDIVIEAWNVATVPEKEVAVAWAKATVANHKK